MIFTNKAAIYQLYVHMENTFSNSFCLKELAAACRLYKTLSLFGQVVDGKGLCPSLPFSKKCLSIKTLLMIIPYQLHKKTWSWSKICSCRRSLSSYLLVIVFFLFVYAFFNLYVKSLVGYIVLVQLDTSYLYITVILLWFFVVFLSFMF